MFKRTAIALAILFTMAAFSIHSFAANPTRDPRLVKAQYDTVISRLDTGGDLLVFANVDGLLEETLGNLIDIVTLAPDQDADTKEMKAILAKLPGFLKAQGFYAVEGFGISSVPRADGLYDTKMFVSRKVEAAGRPLWRSMVGLKQRRLAGLDFLPKDTVMAQVTANDLKETWKLVEAGVNELGTPQIIQGFTQGIAMGSAVIGVDLATLISTLGDENFFSLQLSSTSTIDVPMGPGQMVSIPSPTLLIGIAVSDNTLATVLEQAITKTGMPLQKSTVNGSILQTMNIPVPSPVPVSLTFATHKGILLLGSSAQVVTEAIKAYTENFHPRLIGLTGSADQIAAIAEKFLILYQRREVEGMSDYLMDHSRQTYLMGPDGAPIALLSHDGTPRQVADEILQWVK